MPTLVLSLFRFVRLVLSGHVAVAMENAALRLQLVAFQRKPKRPTLTSFDRVFWVGLSLLWKSLCQLAATFLGGVKTTRETRQRGSIRLSGNRAFLK